MLAAVVGGNLQGTEAVYLSKKAGWDVLLIDKNPVAPASGLCDRFIQLDVTCEKQFGNALKGVDLVIPALENEAALISLDHWTKAESIPFAFDLEAYSISSSKLKSDRLFARNMVPIPQPWPNCDEWVATLIVCEKDRDAAKEKRNRVIADIQRSFNIEIFRDSSPMETAKGKQA